MTTITPTLTKDEVLAKLDSYKSSGAPTQVKEQAIAALLKEYSFYFSSEVAKEQFEESQPDYSDI